jgi:hypothetical protein
MIGRAVNKHYLLFTGVERLVKTAIAVNQPAHR